MGRLDFDGVLIGPHEFQDSPPQFPILGGQEAKGFALRPRPGGAAHAVDIVFRVAGQIVIDHMGDMVDVQTPGRDVRGHQDEELAFPKLVNGLAPLGLGAAPVDAGGLEPLFLEAVHDAVHPVLGAGKDKHRTLPFLELGGKLLGFLGLGGVEDFLGDLRQGLGGGADSDAHRVLEVLRGHLLDIVRDGGGEKKCLALPRQLLADLIQLRGETHVQHPIRFVQNEEAVLAEVERAQQYDD